MSKTKNEEWLTPEQAAERLGVTVGRVRQLIQRGQLAAQQFGRFYLLTPETVKNYVPRPRGRRPKQ